MTSSDFQKMFGVGRSAMPRIPKPRLAPVPPLAAKMFEAQRGGWIDFVLSIDDDARVSKVEVVGYSDPRLVIPAATALIRRWRFFDGTKPGYYLLRVTYSIVGSDHADVAFR